MTNPQCIHIPDGSVVVSGELFDMACAAIAERDKLLAEIEALIHDNERLMKSLNAEVNVHEPKACETFPGEVHPLGKLTNLICDVIEHARDSSPHSNEFEALVQTMWDEYNAKLLAQGASRDASSEPAKCSFCGETKIHGQNCGYFGQPVRSQ